MKAGEGFGELEPEAEEKLEVGVGARVSLLKFFVC